MPSASGWERNQLEFPGYIFRASVSNLAFPPEGLWRDYNHRADTENRIAERKHDLGADDFSMQEFFPHRTGLP